MRVIPVLDLMAGRAVLASRGLRVVYAPVRSVLVREGEPGGGDALALGRAFRAQLGCDEWYVADLDAITGGPSQRALVRSLTGLGGRLLVDAGVASPARARETLADGAGAVVIGLETLPSFAALQEIVQAVGSHRVIFSLDLRDGTPVVRAGAPHHGTPLELLQTARAAGVGAVLVLDLARIGTGLGVHLPLVCEIRRAHPDVELLAGGGIASVRDLEQLADAGCDGALVATALHDGGLGAEDIKVVRRRGDPRPGGHANDSR